MTAQCMSSLIAGSVSQIYGVRIPCWGFFSDCDLLFSKFCWCDVTFYPPPEPKSQPNRPPPLFSSAWHLWTTTYDCTPPARIKDTPLLVTFKIGLNICPSSYFLICQVIYRYVWYTFKASVMCTGSVCVFQRISTITSTMVGSNAMNRLLSVCYWCTL